MPHAGHASQVAHVVNEQRRKDPRPHPYRGGGQKPSGGGTLFSGSQLTAETALDQGIYASKALLFRLFTYSKSLTDSVLHPPEVSWLWCHHFDFIRKFNVSFRFIRIMQGHASGLIDPGDILYM